MCEKIIGRNTPVLFDEFLERAKLVHFGKYTYDRSSYVNTKTKMTITCDCGNIFMQSPEVHLRPSGCILCGNKRSNDSKRLTTDEFIKKSILKHGDKYKYNLVDYKSAHEKVLIICDKHYPTGYRIAPQSHLSGTGCNKCGRIHDSPEQMSIKLTKFLDKAKIVHGDKFNYDKVTVLNVKEKIEISCKNGHTFFQEYRHHLRGSGCRLCNNIESSRKIKYTTEQFVAKAIDIHKDKYTYDKSIYTKSSNKLIVTCPIHGDFSITPNSHIGNRKCGCIPCGRLITSAYQRENLKDWRHSSWHRDGLKSKNFTGFKLYVIRCWATNSYELSELL
jgi:hypothetical protein